MIVIGLTGGIGSGKSTVAHLFAKRGVPIIDADVIARELTQPKMPALREIVRHFKDENLLKDGQLNRRKLREIIFKNPDEKKWLENLLHPLIRNKIKDTIKTIRVPYCIAVIPLLVEAEHYSFIKRILVIDTPQELQIKRAKERDKISLRQIKAILKSQTSRDHRLSKAHDVITNDGSLIDLEEQVEKFHQKYIKMSS